MIEGQIPTMNPVDSLKSLLSTVNIFANTFPLRNPDKRWRQSKIHLAVGVFPPKFSRMRGKSTKPSGSTSCSAFLTNIFSHKASLGRRQIVQQGRSPA